MIFGSRSLPVEVKLETGELSHSTQKQKADTTKEDDQINEMLNFKIQKFELDERVLEYQIDNLLLQNIKDNREDGYFLSFLEYLGSLGSVFLV